MVGCSNGDDGLNVGIHYSDKLATLQAEKERFEGSKSMTQIVTWRCQPKNNNLRDQNPQLEEQSDVVCPDKPNRGIETPHREAWRHCWPARNNSRDKNPQLG
jgi:hypothetical protein